MQGEFNFGEEIEERLSKLSLSLDDILQRGLVEKERLEYKRGWNPEEVLHTLCAYANDFYNLDGGYIIIGIATTDEGEPILPPTGVPERQLDEIGRKLTEFSHKISPSYVPLVDVCTIQGKKVVVLRAHGGQNRPYKVPIRLSNSSNEKAYYIRRNSCTVRVTLAEDELELINLSNKIPHDDRLNQRAKISDLDPKLITDYLLRVKSALALYSPRLSVDDFGTRMNIAGGPPEDRHPINVGLMFFNPHPEQFFPQTQVDVVQFPDGVDGDRIIEKTFIGPLGKQLTEALNYLQNNILKTIIIKEKGKAEAKRAWNYPYEALEEILPNAVYHRSYEIREPIEVRVEPERLTITSYPGPDRSIRLEDLKQGRVLARRYRNRRIGEFLKELDLTEGRGTGIPKVIRVMRENGSPMPEFQTDENRTYFTAILPVHPRFLSSYLDGDLDARPSKSPSKSATGERELAILIFCQTPHSRAEIQEHIGLKNVQNFRIKYLWPLLERELLTMTNLESPTSRLQKYRTTAKGVAFLEGLKE